MLYYVSTQILVVFVYKEYGNNFCVGLRTNSLFVLISYVNRFRDNSLAVQPRI